MTEQENWMWLVGLLEGEGCFAKGTPSKPNNPRAMIGSTDREVIDRVAALWGIAYVNTVKPVVGKTGSRHRRYHMIQIGGSTAVRLMLRIRPYLCRRRQAAIDRVLASYAPRRADSRLAMTKPFELVQLCEHPFCTTPASQMCLAHPKPQRRLKLVV